MNLSNADCFSCLQNTNAVLKPVSQMFRRYPIAFWTMTGAGFYLFKCYRIGAVYQFQYGTHIKQR